jgi:hypothetical protein
MGNVAVAEKLPGRDELDELYPLTGSETEPEDEDDEDQDDGEAEDGEEFEPDDIPHG